MPLLWGNTRVHQIAHSGCHSGWIFTLQGIDIESNESDFLLNDPYDLEILNRVYELNSTQGFTN